MIPRWQRPPSRHPNPVIAALRDNRGRYVRIRMKAGETFAAFLYWSQRGRAVLRQAGTVRAKQIPYGDIETVEAIPGEPDHELGRAVDRTIRDLRHAEWRAAEASTA